MNNEDIAVLVKQKESCKSKIIIQTQTKISIFKFQMITFKGLS